MKLSLIVFLHFVTFTEVSLAWSLPSFPVFLRRHPQIPKFIRDIDHPWIQDKENLIKVWRLENPKSALCNLSSELRPSNASHGFTYPTDLFKSLRIDTRRTDRFEYDIYRHRLIFDKSDWSCILQQIKETLDCPAALQDIEHLTVLTHWPEIDETLDPSRPSNPAPIEVPNLFVNLLKSMPHLQKLEWNSFGENDEMFRRAFIETDLTLPELRHLSLTLDNNYLVGMCPGLESIRFHQRMPWWLSKNESRSVLQLVHSLDSIPNLKSFSMHAAWKLEYLEVMVEKSPNITNLTIENNYFYPSSDFNFYDRDPNAPGERLKNYTNVLAGFPLLENLWLPDVAELNLGYDGGSDCGTDYSGPDGRESGRFETRQRVKATELASDIVLAKLPGLKTLSFDETHPNVTRDELGRASAAWPWTGRLEEYTYEMWPDKERFAGEDAEAAWSVGCI